MSRRTVESVLEEHRDRLMAVPGVVGTAVGACDGKTCIKVYIAPKSGLVKLEIPSVLEGYAVIVEETGEFRGK